VKYQVTITLDKTEDMKSGMTAAAVINIEEANNVIVIPSAAINEKNGETYVYTKKDGDELSGEVAVTTGLSNGNMVEVTSGLEEGDTVYYEIRTKDSSSGGDSDKRGGMQNMGNGMPGDMPQGGPGEGSGQGRPGGDGNNGGSN
jgi:multidrug efflux pump subunit AcrA (membrane-fusion protein)